MAKQAQGLHRIEVLRRDQIPDFAGWDILKQEEKTDQRYESLRFPGICSKGFWVELFKVAEYLNLENAAEVSLHETDVAQVRSNAAEVVGVPQV